MFAPWYVEAMAEAPIARRVTEVVRRARTPKTCDHCPGKVAAGERYRRTFWLIDDEPTVTVCHLGGGCADAWLAEATAPSV